MAVVRVKDEDGAAAVADARALYDLFHCRSGAAGLCRRAQLDVAVMAKSAELLKTKVYWLPGEWMLADPLTKRLGNSTWLRKVMDQIWADKGSSQATLWSTP